MNRLALALLALASLMLPAAITHPGFNGASAACVACVLLALIFQITTPRKANR